MLLVAAPSSYRTAAYVAAANGLGARVLLATEGDCALLPEGAEGLRVDLSVPDAAARQILAAVRRQPIHGVVATDDAGVTLASQVAEALGLPHNPVPSARIARRKDLARAALAAAGVPVPAFRKVNLDRDILAQCRGLGFPCVVKPLSLSGSRGVIRADDPETLLGVCARVGQIIASLSDPEERRHVLVERFVPGVEVAVEGMLSKGELRVLAVFDKPDPLDGPFFEETYYITPSRLPEQTQTRIAQRVQAACNAYGLREGPVHAELRIDDTEAWIVEVAARTIGGDCARLLRFGTGRPLESLVIDHALGRALVVDSSNEAAGVLMIPTPSAGTLRRIEGVLAARNVPHVDDIEIAVREGYELTPLPEGSAYLGFIFAHAPTPGEVETALRRAHARLNIVVAPCWHIERAAPAISVANA